MGSRKVYFYNSRNRDRLYNADSMTDWLNPFFTTGVFNNCFRVTANNNMTVTVAGGYANIEGKTVNYSGSETFDLTVASGTLSRIDNIILRRDDTTRDIYLMVQTGGLSVNPVPPPIVRENAIYDLKLAEVRVNKGTITITQANITDTRMNATVCGWVVATVKEVDFSSITAQFNAFFAEYKPKIEGEYKTYVDTCNNFFNLYRQLVIENYNDFITAINGYHVSSAAEYAALLSWFEGFKTSSTAALNNWFAEIKDVLSGDIAGSLALQIEELKARVTELENQGHGGSIYSTKAWLNKCYLGNAYLSDRVTEEVDKEAGKAWLNNCYLAHAYLSKN